MKWSKVFGDMEYDEENAFVIPETGIYFVYISITLDCQDNPNKKLYVQLQKRNDGYNEDIYLMDAWNAVVCTQQPRTLFIGELFDLSQGEHVKARIMHGSELIRKASFGAYLI